MKIKTVTASALFVAALTIAGGASAVNAQCTPATVTADDFFVDGVLNVNAYLAAVQAANAACAPGGGALPATGGDASHLLPIALGFVAVGGASLATANNRRRLTRS
jgi:LPXTG-motif cell wall-anchored protein